MSKSILQCTAKVQPKNIMPAEAMHANPPDPTPDHGQCPPLSCPTVSRSSGPGTALDSTVSTLHEGIDNEKVFDPESAKIEEETTTESKSPSIMGADTEEMTFPDGGLRAWLVVLGCFMYGCSCMGWGLVWGVLQDYYHTNLFPDTKLSVLSIVGGLCNFTMNGSSYFFGGLGDRFGYKRMIAISCFLAYCCLLASAFTTKIYHLFLFQGALFGLAQGIGLPLYMSLSSQWFYKKRGLATGLAVSGAGIGGGLESLIVRPMLTNLGFKKTMIIYSTMHAVVWVIAWFLIKERIPRGKNANKKRRWLPKKITGSFYSVALSMFFGIFGYLSPYYFSPTYTRQFVPSINPSSLLISVPLVLMNFCLGLGRQFSGASIGGAILSATDNNWTAVTMYSGSMQLIGAACILYARFHKDRRILAVV
ncbi:hypothetical protein VKT23_010506 [Stygiomarasmius scandens]|uniref:MFS general substrate transporter n=1 Tax=Marasmiellus scandens TaxID=2682957 RepID=A0ABR1JH27_9AGAR